MLFYKFEPPGSKYDLDSVRKCLNERLRGNYESSPNDEIVHFLLSVLASTTPYLKKLIIRIELEMFIEQLSKISVVPLRQNLRSFIDYLQSEVLQRKLPGTVRKTLVVVVHILKTVEERSQHVFNEGHSPECGHSKLLLPFTFPRRMVAMRLVELVRGKAHVYCGSWKLLLEDVFDHLLDVESALLSKNKVMLKNIFESEDDRLRRIIQDAAEFLGGQPVSDFKLTLDNIDTKSRYFPPCMANLHQILRKTHRLSYDSRYQYTVFLKDAGLDLEDNIAFWAEEYNQVQDGSSCCHDWKQKETRYVYQIKHIYGLVGDSVAKFCRTCDIFVGKLSAKMNGGCPFEHSTPASLRNSIPVQLENATDAILDLQAKGKPNQACAVYLSYQKPIPGVKSIVNPIQYYNLAVAN